MDKPETNAAGVVALPLSFEAFYAEEHERLFGLMCLVSRDRSEAEEITQEAFVRVWERWLQVSAMGSPAGYLYRIAMNEFRNRDRRAALGRRLFPHAVPRRSTHSTDEATVLLHEALRMLEPRQRAALILTELLGYSAKEAGRALGVKPSTIGALKYQGRARLREAEIND